VGARDLLGILRRHQFAAVHTHNAHHGIVGRHLGRVRGLPVFHTWRYDPLDASESRLQQIFYGLAEASATRASRAVMFQNPEDLELAVQRRIVPHKKAVLVGNGIVTERYEQPTRGREEVRRELDLPLDAQVVLCIARLAERKGQPDLLRALRLLAESHPHLRLLLVGTGPDEEDLRGLAHELGIAERVHFAGHRDDVPDVLHASDVLCLPSRREGIPRAVMEAMAAGVPVVATNVVGTRSLVEDGCSGLLAEYGNPADLATALERILDEPGLGARLAAVAAETVTRDWEQQSVVERVGRLYETALR
jgi:glycosyltransferase involved in cell wall biosynthesis